MTIDSLFTRDPWPHQREGVERTIAALEDGVQSLCLTGPTGSGKTEEMLAICRWATGLGQRVLIFTNRILLTQQTRRVFENADVLVGIISASMPEYEYAEAPIQLATMQTVLSRRRKTPTYWVKADIVLVDEVHQQASGESATLLQEYKERGAKVCGVTATPLGVSGVCDELIVAGRTRDLQDAGILCSALWFAPSELDTRNLVKGRVDLSFAEDDARRTWGPLRGNDQVRTRIVGNILEHYQRLHPEGTHTLAFAPGVRESLWAAQFCTSRGIRALHIDGEDFWADGELRDRKGHQEYFERYMDAWRRGEIPIIWNRFVMREGIDEPQIECLLLATPVGSYRSFLQMVGRALRASEETPQTVLVLDHGGNWWRWGSVNINVDWEDTFECPDPDTPAKNRVANIRETGESVGRACPKCGMVHSAKGRFLHCQYCGHEMFVGKASRPILQADGTLVEVNGEPIRQWEIKDKPQNAKTWAALYWNALKHKGGEITFNQLYAQFGYKTAVEQGSEDKPAWWKRYYPPRNLPLMPRHPNDWHRLVKDVSKEALRGKKECVYESPTTLQ